MCRAGIPLESLAHIPLDATCAPSSIFTDHWGKQVACEKCGGCYAVSEFSTDALKEELGRRRARAWGLRVVFDKEHDVHGPIRHFITISSAIVSLVLMIIGLGAGYGPALLAGVVGISICCLLILWTIIGWVKLGSKFSAKHPEEAKLLQG